MGCGEATAIRMMLAATGFVYGADNVGMSTTTPWSSPASPTGTPTWTAEQLMAPGRL